MPLISKALRFWLPVACRAASKLATAPPEKRARNSTASSTVTLPLAAAPAARGDAAAGHARRQRPLLDERLGDRPGDFGDFLAGDEAGHVDDVGVQIAVGAGAGQLLVEPPHQRHRLGRPNLADRLARTCRISPSLPALTS